MNLLQDFFNNFINIVSTISVNDIIDMVIVSFLIYKTTTFIRETRAQQLIKGLVVLILTYFIAELLDLNMISFVFEYFFQWGLLAFFIMFQPELRRILEKMGRTKVSKFNLLPFNNENEGDQGHPWEKAIEIVAEATMDLSSTATGALIVLERETRLGEQIDTGTLIYAQPSVALFGNIFFTKTPLHDGAVIMRDGVILAAGCFLPKPQKEELINKLLGSRHRAAIGMSENSDAIVIVVSEETGTVSIALDGELIRGFTKDSLKTFLISKMLPEEKQENKKDVLSFFGKVIKGDKNGRK